MRRPVPDVRPGGGLGKCLVQAFGGNVCAEIIVQASSCTACEPPTCVNCRCVLATGSDDRCATGVDGEEFFCVRAL